eukprot:6177585-Pleurochrysis_carterae.AAC.2
MSQSQSIKLERPKIKAEKTELRERHEAHPEQRAVRAAWRLSRTSKKGKTQRRKGKLRRNAGRLGHSGVRSKRCGARGAQPEKQEVSDTHTHLVTRRADAQKRFRGEANESRVLQVLKVTSKDRSVQPHAASSPCTASVRV